MIFHGATLAAIAQQCPRTVADLQGISEMGAKKPQACEAEVLRVYAAWVDEAALDSEFFRR